MARGSSKADLTPRSLARSKDVLDQFIARQEGIEGRKMSAAKVLDITANLLSPIDTYEDRLDAWEKEMKDIADWNGDRLQNNRVVEKDRYETADRLRDYTKEGPPKGAPEEVRRGWFDRPEPLPRKPYPKKPEKPAKELYELADKLIDFLGRVAHHQSNDSSDYKNPRAMVAAYHALPESIKPLVTAPKGLVKRLYRGDELTDGDNPTTASFATSPRNVSFWGRYVYKGTDIKSFDGIIDSSRIEKNFSGRSKIMKTLERIEENGNNLEVYAGEDEKIVFGIKWKKNVGKDEWMDNNGRNAETFKSRWKDRGGE
jgi:hypothetical protein